MARQDPDGPLDEAARLLASCAARRAEAREALKHLALEYREHLEADRRAPSPSKVEEELLQIVQAARSLRGALERASQRAKGALAGTWPLEDGPDEETLDWLGAECRAALERLAGRAEAAAPVIRDAGRGRRGAMHRALHGTPKGQLAARTALLFGRHRPGELSRDSGLFPSVLETVARAASPDPDATDGLVRAAYAAVPLAKRRLEAERALREASEKGDAAREAAARKQLQELNAELSAL